MASLSLRAYLQKIENLIERGQTEESIAHCKHILNKFPKHVDTYRLLGKSYLEMQRYQEASDVLQRVLSVSPDDFVAQIGMSIIREDSENLDEAIWHMERAFEIQPSNNAVQDELKRLYGRRDGAVPQKILLTRGALVRMYVRGEAYPQAIAEGIAALKEDPLRPDIQLLLAKSYLRTNQINEGYQICTKILESLPFSYEANQLIAEIHILTKQSEQAEPYLERVRMLDPYAAFVNENAPTSAKVDQNAIIIEELNYDAMAASLEAAETSTGSVYIEDDFDTSSLEIPTPGDSQPIELDEDFSWMQDMMDGVDSIQDKQPSAPKDQAPASEVHSRKENVPAAPTSDDSDEFDVEALFSEDSSEEDDAFEALFSEISQNNTSESSEDAVHVTPQADAKQEPMTMAEFFESSSPESASQTTDDDFAALFAENASSEAEATESKDDDFAALFDEFGSVSEQAVDAEEAVPAAEPLSQEINLTAPAAENEALESLFQNEAPAAEGQIEAPITETVTDDSDEELPDWLKELDQESKDADIEVNLQNEIDSLFTNGDLPTSESIQEESTQAQFDDEEDFTAKFLEELENEPQHPGKTRMFSMTADLSSGDSGPLPPLPEDMVPADKPSEDDLPDWLKQLEEQTDQFSADVEFIQSPETVEPPAASKSIDAMTEEEEDRLREQFKAAQQPVTATAMPTEDDDDGFAWLESLAAKQSGFDETPPAISETPVDALPVESPDTELSEKSAAPVSSSSIDSMTEEEEERLREQFRNAQPINAESPINSDDDDDSFAWLESLAAKQSASDSMDAGNIQATAIPEMGQAAVGQQEEPVQAPIEEPAKAVSSSTIDSMTEEEEEQLREKFKTSHQTGQLKQTVSENEDDSFAWLESLAAKQGASEESLLTDETDRATDTPDWLQEMPSIDDHYEPVAEAASATHDEISDETIEPIEEQPVTISKLEQAEILDETGPHTLIEEPIWVDEFTTTEPETIEQAQTIETSSIVEEFDPNLDLEIEAAIDEAIPVLQNSNEESTVEDIVEKENAEERIIAAPATPDEIPDWLKDLEDQTSIYAFTDEEKAKQDIASIDDVEIPGWIADVNETLQIEVEDDTSDDGDLIPDVHAESFITAEDTTEEDQSAAAFEAVGLNIGELEKQLAEENIIEHVDGDKVYEPVEKKQDTELHIEEPVIPEPVVQEPVNEEPVSASIQTEQPAAAEEVEEIVFDIPSDFVDEILQEPEPTGPVMPISEDDTEQFAVLRNYLSTNKISEALTIADELIDKEVYLENIIEELNKTIVDHPLDPAIFIRLGDAYIRNNQIQKALDMYQEAETLLQK